MKSLQLLLYYYLDIPRMSITNDRYNSSFALIEAISKPGYLALSTSVWWKYTYLSFEHITILEV